MAEIGRFKDAKEALKKLPKSKLNSMTAQEICDYIEQETGEKYYTEKEFWKRVQERVKRGYEQNDNI